MTKDNAPVDDKPPALPAMMIVEILREIADEETLITERVRKKGEIEKLIARDDIKAVLEIEAEVGQEVFAFGVASTKEIAINIVNNAFRALGKRADAKLRNKLIERIKSIKPANPYTNNGG